jgi:hypothetical protein
LTAADQNPSVALADLLIHGESHLRKKIYLTWEAQQEIRKTWLSQANHIMDKSGLDAGQFSSKLISILGSRIYSLR